MRLIDADALINLIKNSCSMGGYMGKVVEAIYEYFIKVVESMPTAVDLPELKEAYQDGYKDGQNDRPQGEWIPVSERLPEQGNQSYLVTVDYGDGVVCSCQRFFFSENIGWNDDCVVAWQPLPEPYEKGGAE